MFTGIITDIGIIDTITPRDNGIRMTIRTNYNTSTMDIGCSIAHDGVCLTVTHTDTNKYNVDISDETLSCSTLSNWRKGTRINLERALRVGDELGGHMVLGHVDAVAKVIKIAPLDDHTKITFEAPAELQKFIAAKGSVTLNGVSLTVNGVDDEQFWVNLIPHTLQHTTFENVKVGGDINLEIDTLARYALNRS